MKIRTGFVSNSSTSSFLIYGVCFGSDELLEKVGKDPETDSVWDVIEEIESELGMDYYSPYDWGEIYIGVSWDGVGDDETGAQFKAKIEKKLKAKFGDDIECGTHEGAWHDG